MCVRAPHPTAVGANLQLRGQKASKIKRSGSCSRCGTAKIFLRKRQYQAWRLVQLTQHNDCCITMHFIPLAMGLGTMTVPAICVRGKQGSAGVNLSAAKIVIGSLQAKLQTGKSAASAKGGDGKQPGRWDAIVQRHKSSQSHRIGRTSQLLTFAASRRRLHFSLLSLDMLGERCPHRQAQPSSAFHSARQLCKVCNTNRRGVAALQLESAIRARLATWHLKD